MGRINSADKQIGLDMEVFNYGPVVIFRWKNEPGWPVTYVSGNVGLNFGYTVEAFTSGEVLYEDVIHPLDLKRINRELSQHINDNMFNIHHEPYRIITGKGDIRWVSDFTVMSQDEDGKIDSFIGYIFDITDQTVKEKDLTEYKDRYLHLLDATKEGVWDWDLRTDEVFFSKRWKQMLGYADDEIKGSLLEWEKRVHPDDIQDCYKDIQAHLNGETLIYENTHRMLTKNGTYIWILDRGVKILDDKGKVYRMIGTHKDITLEKEMNERLMRMTQEDSLTGLLNRRAYYRILHRELAESARYSTSMSFVMLDIDHFKHVNDTWGHKFGDLVLKRVAEIMRELIRETDFVFRLGGEEFGILLTQTDAEGAVDLAERLRKRVALEAFQPNASDVITITVSMGVAEYKDTLGVDDFAERADKALYEAKENGRDRVVLYADE